MLGREMAKLLKFTPLEFETLLNERTEQGTARLKFTPLEFETVCFGKSRF